MTTQSDTTAWVDPVDQAVKMVERYQRLGFVHPYTCGNADHDWRKDDDWTTLKPERRGKDVWLVCLCGYEQRLGAVDGMFIANVNQWTSVAFKCGPVDQPWWVPTDAIAGPHPLVDPGAPAGSIAG